MTKEEQIAAAMEKNQHLWDSKYSQDAWSSPVVKYTGEKRKRGVKGVPVR